MQSPPVAGVRSPRRRVLAVVLMAVLVLGALGGCARVRTALALQPDDTVTGEIVLATPQTSPDDRGPSLTLPEDFRDKIDVTDYRQDGYTGSVLRFSGLSFDQVSRLAGVAGPAGQQRTELTLRRAGNRVLITGKVDLTTIPVDKADFQLKISAPGEVLETNGDTESGTISWTFTPGQVGDVRASVAYDDPNAPSATAWTIGLALVVAAASVGVVRMAHRTRNPPVSPSGR
ncbi:DUF3153 domain-containing protein [Pseudonocardia sp. N23]|uniref:LppM family (lipo)protein n=1 Tax=Pseudonocardia sp. N23 TaxID=1987376 RepID=UPI000BFD5A88|nr:DUF3153 domain-containing protein [Pseudonocardia sp. N23]GAY11294.1 lipoprotein LppM [Pseudonocardia sp. N23]